MATTTPTRPSQPLESTPFLPSSSPTDEGSPLNSITSSSRAKGDESGSTQKRYTFTPQRVKALPRAWERRPATPYIPRNDAQRIWKRVPLGEVMIHASETWRKGNTALNARPVKRLRVGQVDQEEDKENIDYVPSKWEEDATSAASPKRKVSGFVVVNDGLGSGEYEDDSDEREDTTVEDEDPALSPSGRSTGSSEATPLTLGSKHDLGDSGVDGCASRNVSDQVNLPSEREDVQSPPTIASNDATSFPNAVGDAIIPSLDTSTETAPMLVITQESQDTVAELTDPSIDQPLSQPLHLTSDDDTAYLHDFLSRARAQKAARQQSTEHILAPSTAGMDATEVISEVATSHIEDVENDTIITQTEEDTTSLQPDPEPEMNNSSPRRSSRLITRLPLPQKPVTSLPNTISLKRLNGTEFIATQKETQSLALATRTNTKRNKGDSVSVSIKLMQLHAEAKAKALEAEITSPEVKRRKKRSKEVSWDATIARYQDGSPPEEDVPEQVEQDETEGVAGGAEKDNDQEQERAAQAVVSEEKKQVVRKVRRLRKLNAGTVNGTPAPKRTLRMSLSGLTTDEALGGCVGEQDRASVQGRRTDGAGLTVGANENRIQTRTRARQGLGLA